MIGDGGKISMSISQNSGHVVLDVLGYYSKKSPGRFVAVTPQRIFDTRTPQHGPIITTDRTVPIHGRGGVPADATAGCLA